MQLLKDYRRHYSSLFSRIRSHSISVLDKQYESFRSISTPSYFGCSYGMRLISDSVGALLLSPKITYVCDSRFFILTDCSAIVASRRLMWCYRIYLWTFNTQTSSSFFLRGRGIFGLIFGLGGTTLVELTENWVLELLDWSLCQHKCVLLLVWFSLAVVLLLRD